MASSSKIRRSGNGRFAKGTAPANPNGRRGRDDGADRADGWINSLSGFGVSGVDKTASNEFAVDVVDYQTARDLWRGNDLAATIVEDPAGEMFREGFCVSMEDEDEVAEVHEALEQLGACAKLTQCLERERAYGGAALFPVINDSTADLAFPLDEGKIPEITSLQVFEPAELVPLTFYDDIFHPKFRDPETYQLVPLHPGSGYSQRVVIHESRLIVFPGIKVTAAQVSGVYGWGDSVLTRVWKVLSDFGIGWSSASILLQEFAQGVYSMEGLAQVLATAGGVTNRLKGMMLGKSTIKALLIDSKDKFERQQTPISGLAELLQALWVRLAAAARMPVTRLAGQSPSGLNATGASDIRGWYDQIAAEQKDCLPQVRRLVQLLFLSKEGPTSGEEPEWAIEWKPLWQPSEQEQAAARLTQAQVDQVYIQNSVLEPIQVLKARFGTGKYSFETPIDPADIAAAEKAVEEQAKLAEQAAAAQAAQGVMPGQQPGQAAGREAGGTKPGEKPSSSADDEYAGAPKRADDFNPDEARDEHGMWTSGGGGGSITGGKSGGSGKEPKPAKLTSQEKRLVHLMSGPRISDKAITAALGVSHEEALKLAASAREKLGVRPGETIREAGRAIEKVQESGGLARLQTTDRQFYRPGKGWAPERVALHKEFAEKVITRKAKPEKSDRADTIVERDGKWYVYSEDGSKKLGGPYDSKAEAVARLGQIEHFKEQS